MGSRAGWVHEHGREYDVPDVIAEAEGIEDLSWHNDTCPSFGKDIADPITHHHDHCLKIWVEHPDPKDRDSGMRHRFAVNYHYGSADPVPGVPTAENGDEIYHGDDPSAALAVFMETLTQIQLEMGRRRHAN